MKIITLEIKLIIYINFINNNPLVERSLSVNNLDENNFVDLALIVGYHFHRLPVECACGFHSFPLPFKQYCFHGLRRACLRVSQPSPQAVLLPWAPHLMCLQLLLQWMLCWTAKLDGKCLHMSFMGPRGRVVQSVLISHVTTQSSLLTESELCQKRLPSL